MKMLMKNKMNIFNIFWVNIMSLILLNSSSIYVQWLSMEFSTMLMISMINIKSKNKIVSTLYYIMSSISSMMVIAIISMNLSQMYNLINNNINLMLMISLYLKIGMFPFCFWMIFIYKLSSWSQIFLISTFMKFIPIYFYMSLINFSSSMFISLIMNNIFISFYTNLNFSLKKLFACSSIFNSLFFIIIIQINKNMCMLFFVIYVILFYFLTYMFDYYNIENLNFNNMSYKSLNITIILMFTYSSFPLFITFMMKWEFIYLLNMNLKSNMMILIILMSMFMLWNYFILFKTLIIKFLNKNLMMMEMISMKLLIPMTILFYMCMFLLFNLM
nr:TPA_asm: ND2 [Bombus haemorrhoidalis]